LHVVAGIEKRISPALRVVRGRGGRRRRSKKKKKEKKKKNYVVVQKEVCDQTSIDTFFEGGTSF